MRGPGPKWRAKHAPAPASLGVIAVPVSPCTGRPDPAPQITSSRLPVVRSLFRRDAIGLLKVRVFLDFLVERFARPLAHRCEHYNRAKCRGCRRSAGRVVVDSVVSVRPDDATIGLPNPVPFAVTVEAPMKTLPAFPSALMPALLLRLCRGALNIEQHWRPREAGGGETVAPVQVRQAVRNTDFDETCCSVGGEPVPLLPSIWTRCNETKAPFESGRTRMPVPFWKISVSETMRVPDPPVGAKPDSMRSRGLELGYSAMFNLHDGAAVTLIPLAPPPIVPSMSRPRRMTVIPPVVILTPATTGDRNICAVEGDRLRDGDRTEAAGIQAIDDTAGSGLGDRTRKCLAGCRYGRTDWHRRPGPTPKCAAPGRCARSELSISTHRHPIAVTSNEALMIFPPHVEILSIGIERGRPSNQRRGERPVG